LIGSELVPRLSRAGYRVTRLTRGPAGPGTITWDPANSRLDPAQLAGVAAVIHLAGENVGARWTPARKARIRDSRVGGTRLLSKALAGLPRPPRVLISSSAVGIYGNRGSAVLTETSPPGDPKRSFLTAVCLDWEAAAEPARAAGIRVVHPRFGVVLSRRGGALAKLLLPFRLGLGGTLGSGWQWMSWISVDDAVSAILHTLIDERLEGPVNVTSPEAVTNRDFVGTLGRVLGRPTLVPIPAGVLRLIFGEMAQSTMLDSARVEPEKLLRAGYQFQHPDLERALRHVLGVPGQ